MRFIVFTSLFSLIGLFLFLYVIRFISKKMKPVVKTGREIISGTVKTINNATPAISHYTSSFLNSVNSGLSSFNVDLAVNRFQDYLSRNPENIDHVNKMVGSLEEDS
ncbi:MAG: hypothetical protein K6F46_06085 [Desulfovibrio sp.]|nr:hypothetical protein [Desulfovibrio sp.]